MRNRPEEFGGINEFFRTQYYLSHPEKTDENIKASLMSVAPDYQLSDNSTDIFPNSQWDETPVDIHYENEPRGERDTIDLTPGKHPPNMMA